MIASTWAAVDGKIAAGIDDEIGPFALFRIRRLASQDRLEFLRGHARPSKNACPLDLGRGGDNDDLVERRLAAGLEQQGDVEQQDRRVGMISDEPLASFRDGRVDDGFERGKRFGIAEHLARKAGAIEDSVLDRAGKPPCDRPDQHPAQTLQPVDLGVGVEQRNSGALEHRRDGRFAHSDRAGDRDLDHASISPRSRSAASNGIKGMPRIVK